MVQVYHSLPTVAQPYFYDSERIPQNLSQDGAFESAVRKGPVIPAYKTRSIHTSRRCSSTSAYYTVRRVALRFAPLQPYAIDKHDPEKPCQTSNSLMRPTSSLVPSPYLLSSRKPQYTILPSFIMTLPIARPRPVAKCGSPHHPQHIARSGQHLTLI